MMKFSFEIQSVDHTGFKGFFDNELRINLLSSVNGKAISPIRSKSGPNPLNVLVNLFLRPRVRASLAMTKD